MPNYFKLPLVTITEQHSKITEMEYLIDVLPKLSEDGPWIAGGSLLRTKIGLSITTDVDIFFKSEQQLYEYKIKLQLDYEGKRFTYLTDSDSTYAKNVFIKYMDRKYKLQLIKRKFYDSPCKLLDDFDINICQLAYDGKSLYVEENAIQSIEDKTFYLNKISNGASIMSRCMKYASLGFRLPQSEINKFFDTINKDPNKKHTLKDTYEGL
jgi:hypothetical protein